MKVSKNLILREIAGEYILVPVGKAALNIHGMINLSESAYLLWNKMQTDCTLDDLVCCLLKEYDIDENTARNDVLAFIEQMRQVGIIEE